MAAAVSVCFLKRQIEQSDRHERQRLQRQQKAARATLPLTLSGLSLSLRQMLEALASARNEIRNGGISHAFAPPETPVEHIEELQAVIMSTDKRSVVEPIAQIIREIQTLWSRIEFLRDVRQQESMAALELSVDEWILQSAQIHALVESLFAYARGGTDEGPSDVEWGRAESIISQLRIESATLNELIRARSEQSSNFWALK